MPYIVRNTANDRSKAHLHRLASKFTYEPSIGGMRLRLGQSMEITDDQYERIKEMLSGWELKGMVEVSRVGGEAPKTKAEESEAPTPEPESENPEEVTEPVEAAPTVVDEATVVETPEEPTTEVQTQPPVTESDDQKSSTETPDQEESSKSSKSSSNDSNQGKGQSKKGRKKLF